MGIGNDEIQRYHRVDGLARLAERLAKKIPAPAKRWPPAPERNTTFSGLAARVEEAAEKVVPEREVCPQRLKAEFKTVQLAQR